MSLKKYFLISCLLFAVYFINGIIAIPRLSMTGDEGDHMNYAERFAKLHPEKVKPFDDASTMPMSVLNTLPRAVEQLIHPGLKKNDWGLSDIFSGRYMTLLITSLIGFFLLRFSTELYGRKAGLFSLFLFVFSPNLNGHAVLVTTDAFSALFTLTSSWYFRKMILNAGWKYATLFGLHLGMAQLSKQSLTHLYIIFLLLTLYYLFSRKAEIQIKKTLAKSLVSLAIVISVINIGFQFNGLGKSLDQYHFRSTFFTGLQNKLSFIGSMPLPLPDPYFSGLDLTKNIDEIGMGRPESAGEAYILGQRKSGKGFWYYYFVVLFFKTPIPVMICFLFWLFYTRKHHEKFLLTEFPFVFTIVYFLVYFNFFYNSQVGLRHILMIFPLLFLLLGKIADWLFARKWLIGSLAIYSIATFYYFFPNLISYSNEFLIPKRNAYKIMGDSNIDYGQGYYFARSYIERHPDVRFADTIPSVGRQLLRFNAYLDLGKEHRYEWLKKFKPVSQVSHCYLLFDIKKEQISE